MKRDLAYLILLLLISSVSVMAAPTTRVFDDGDGTVTIDRPYKFSSDLKWAANEIERLAYDTPRPEGVPDKYLALSGKNLVECSQAVKDVVDANAISRRNAEVERVRLHIIFAAIVKLLNDKNPGDVMTVAEQRAAIASVFP